MEDTMGHFCSGDGVIAVNIDVSYPINASCPIVLPITLPDRAVRITPCPCWGCQLSANTDSLS